MTQRAEVSAVISQAEGPHRQVRRGACEARESVVAAGGPRGSRLTTALLSRMSLMKMVSRMHVRSSPAGAREQIDITSKLVEAKMKTTAEPHVKEKLNHMQGRPGRQPLQNDTAHSERPEGVSGGLAAGSRFDSESQGRGCRRRLVGRGKDPDAEQEAAEDVTDLGLSGKTLSRGGQ